MKHVVAAIVVNKKSSPHTYLLASSKKDFGEFTGYYYPIAGHVEDGEGYEESLRREVQEEIGVNITSIQEIPNEYASDVSTQVTHWYICELETYNFSIDRSELNHVGFFSQSEITQMDVWPATQHVLHTYVFSKDWKEV